MAALSEFDCQVRVTLAQAIAARGHAPANADLAQELSVSVTELDASLRRLHEAHVLLLHPETTRPWVVHPFALSAGSCWVETARGGYWANCLYCAYGIAAAMRCDAVISTRLGGEHEPVRFVVKDGEAEPSDLIFHLSIPVAHWWRNVIAACASFQPFRSEAAVDDWCARHAMAKGHIFTIDRLWRFAGEWYGAHLTAPWRKRTPDEVRALFARHDLSGPFWEI